MNTFHWIAVAVVVVLSSARLTRLAVFDSFPPAEWLRNKYADWTDGTGWQLIAFCGYCASFWITALVVGSGYYSDWHPAWWLFNGAMGASYLAAILVTFDGDDE